MITIFTDFFSNLNILGIAIALGFTGIVLALYWPPLFKKSNLWIAFIAGGMIGLIALAFIQFPLGELFRVLLHRLWNNDQLKANLLLIGAVSVLIGGLTQKGAKMATVLLYRTFNKKQEFSIQQGLIAGACVGAGFGFMEAQWALNQLFALGWSWQVVEVYGILGLAAFWERFFAIGGHIAMGALGGIGIAKGKGLRYWLIVGTIHALINLSAYVYQSGLVSAVVVELYLAFAAILLSIYVLRFRWEKTIQEGSEPQPLSSEK